MELELGILGLGQTRVKARARLRVLNIIFAPQSSGSFDLQVTI